MCPFRCPRSKAAISAAAGEGVRTQGCLLTGKARLKQEVTRAPRCCCQPHACIPGVAAKNAGLRASFPAIPRPKPEKKNVLVTMQPVVVWGSESMSKTTAPWAANQTLFEFLVRFDLGNIVNHEPAPRPFFPGHSCNAWLFTSPCFYFL